MTAQKSVSTKEGSYWNTRFFKWSLEFMPNIVIIMLGTNDSKEPNWHADSYEADIAALVRTFKYAFKTKPDIYLMIPPGVEEYMKPVIEAKIQPDVIQTDIPKILQKVAKSTDVTIIDLSKLFIDPNEPTKVYTKYDKADPGYWTHDGIHPDDKSYLKMASFISCHLNIVQKPIFCAALPPHAPTISSYSLDSLVPTSTTLQS